MFPLRRILGHRKRRMLMIIGYWTCTLRNLKGAHTHRNLARYDDERGVRGV